MPFPKCHPPSLLWRLLVTRNPSYWWSTSKTSLLARSFMSWFKMTSTVSLMTLFTIKTRSTWTGVSTKGENHATHSSPLAGHPRYLKTYKQIKERFMWKGLKTDVLRFVRECNACQQNKAEHTHPIGLFQSFTIPKQKWESNSMDFIRGLPQEQGSKGRIVFMWWWKGSQSLHTSSLYLANI